MGELSYALSFSLVLLAVLLSRLGRLGLETELLVSSLRAFLQLLALGLVLNELLTLKGFLRTLAVLTLMSLFASFIFTERSRSRALFLPAFVSISLSAALPAGLLVAQGVLKPVAWELLPLGGLLIGNTLNSLTLFYERTKAEIKSRRDEIEARVALGATLYQALEEVIKSAVKNALLPKLNWLRSAGLVHVPGVAVGMLAAGVPPVKAVLFQAAVLYALLLAGLLSSYAFALLAYERLFKESFRL
ncbi:MAG: iron export ABC transporter permease subunit FetB [Aquificae bacterium]|nr:iron export ABC transporter permease subunit FetB [Aquificota bacterium]